jgi:Sodium/hydrogen exchanger family
MIGSLITIAVILIVYGAVSKPLDARGITSAMVLTAAGLAAGTSALKLVNIHIESKAAEVFVELALAFLLFSDSTRIDLVRLRKQLGWPVRLLLIGLPLTIAAGLGAGLLVFPGIAVASAFVLSATRPRCPSRNQSLARARSRPGPVDDLDWLLAPTEPADAVRRRSGYSTPPNHPGDWPTRLPRRRARTPS